MEELQFRRWLPGYLPRSADGSARMLCLLVARTGCSPDGPADLSVASIALTPFSHGIVEAARNHSLFLEFQEPHGVLVLGGDYVFYIETPLGWFQPESPIWGLISMGDRPGHVQVVAQSDTTLAYAATYFGSSCDSLSAYSAALIVLELIPANVTQCFVAASADTTVTVTGTIPAGVDFIRPDSEPIERFPRDVLRSGFSDGPFVIVRADDDTTSDIKFSFSGRAGHNIGTLDAADAKFGVFQGDHWTEFVAVERQPPPGAESGWTALAVAIVLAIVLLVLVFILAIILRVMLVGVPWRKTGDARARARPDLAPDVGALRDIEQGAPDDGAVSDSTISKDESTGEQDAPDNPYDLVNQQQGFL
jgi:hypothetical protein